MLFIVDEPSGGIYYGSMVAAPYAAKIFSQLFSYLGMEPGNNEPEKTVVMPDVVGKTIDEADKVMKQAGLYYEYLDKGGAVSYQLPAPGSVVSVNITAYLEG